MKISRVAIVGGGASGMLVAIRLVRESKSPIEISVIDPSKTVGTGVAYSTSCEAHLLNVPANRMSAFPEEPDHFLRWAKMHSTFERVDMETLANAYLPRKIYGEYLTSLWDQALRTCQESVSLEFVVGEVTDITWLGHERFKLSLLSGSALMASSVILATGNALPGDPPIRDPQFYSSSFYFKNPWKGSAAQGIDSNSDILIIGNGLTMVDTVLSLMEKKHKGTIHSISPHGLPILQHRNTGAPYSELSREFRGEETLLQLTSMFNKHRKRLNGLGLSAEWVIDSMRSHTQALWISLSNEDKVMFLKRLRHLWGVARHRLPPQVFEVIQRLKFEGRLRIWSGTLIDLKDEANRVRVDFFDNKAKIERCLFVSRVINCTGPQSDVEKIEDQLHKNLLRSGLLRRHPLGLGIEAHPINLEIINRDQQPVHSFYVIGSALKGMLWESTAMPEIRVQAQMISRQIVEKFTHVPV